MKLCHKIHCLRFNQVDICPPNLITLATPMDRADRGQCSTVYLYQGRLS